VNIFERIEDIRAFSLEGKRNGKTIGFVPTMGCLHKGHFSLMKEAKAKSDVLIVSNFVNPAQFGANNEDYQKYPRMPEQDNALCAENKVDAVFFPGKDEIYPLQNSTWVIEDELSSGLCGRSRPGHFRGVCMVVAKLFNIVLPDIAVFGQKDYQQAKIIEKMVYDLNFPVKIIIAPTVRDNDGLAMSSRNKYLSPEERKKAPTIFESLENAARQFVAGEKRTNEITGEIRLRISQSGAKVDYIEILDAEILKPIDGKTKKVLIAVAAFFGATRLIDNIVVTL
jgi:pantoate--beta-alanine ligase